MKFSKAEIPVVSEAVGVTVRAVDLGSLTVAWETFPGGLETAPIFAGLPDDRCQCEHWGYVINGQFRAIFADHEETYRAGDLYYMAPGHTTAFDQDSEVIEFSPVGDYAETMAVVERNVTAMMSGHSA